MPLNVVLELSDEDLKYFSRIMESVWKQNAKRPESELIAGARELLKQVRKAKTPAYVTKSLEDIGLLIDLLGDEEWELAPEDRRRIKAALSYFAVKRDIIPDKVPGIGYLDDALMANLVTRELKHDLEGYRDFCAYRATEAKSLGKDVDRDDWLAARRRQLIERISRRRERMWRHRRQEGPTHPILRYQY